MIIEEIEYKGHKGIPSNKTPGSSVNNDMSGWRIEKPVIDNEKCVGCRKCYVFCPDVAMALDEEGLPLVRFKLCKGCGICANECPVGAITMVKEL